MGLHNKMGWRCSVQGCFNQVKRPKIETFEGCFPRNMNFGDVDGKIELNGHFGLLEWKSPGVPLQLAQHISLVRFTLQSSWNGVQGNAVFVVEGNAETMEVARYDTVWKGVFTREGTANFKEVCAAVKLWADWALRQPKPPFVNVGAIQYANGTSPASGAWLKCVA